MLPVWFQFYLNCRCCSIMWQARSLEVACLVAFVVVQFVLALLNLYTHVSCCCGILDCIIAATWICSCSIAFWFTWPFVYILSSMYSDVCSLLHIHVSFSLAPVHPWALADLLHFRSSFTLVPCGDFMLCCGEAVHACVHCSHTKLTDFYRYPFYSKFIDQLRNS